MYYRGSALGGAGEFVACYCCGVSFQACNMVAFRSNPEQGVCVSCAAWLYGSSRPIVRRIYPPIWQLTAAWTSSSAASTYQALLVGFLRTLVAMPAGAARWLRRKLSRG